MSEIDSFLTNKGPFKHWSIFFGSPCICQIIRKLTSESIGHSPFHNGVIEVIKWHLIDINMKMYTVNKTSFTSVINNVANGKLVYSTTVSYIIFENFIYSPL